MKIPQYENPVFIECTSENDADMRVEIGYSSYSSSLFFVGNCGTSAYSALYSIVEFLVSNNIIDSYTGDPDIVNEYPEDYIEIDGYFIPSYRVIIKNIIH